MGAPSVNVLTTRQLADFLGVDAWRVRRLFEDGTLADPPRIAGARAIPRDRIPEVVDALRDRGWLPASTSEQHEASPAVAD